MATSEVGLSNRDLTGLPDCSHMHIGIAVSEWNVEITSALLEGALDTLKKAGIPAKHITVYNTPGSFELPLAAQFLIHHINPDAVICLGSVIRGETDHFTFVCNATASGISEVSLKHNVPVIFGVLTDNTLAQAKARAGGEHGNKGVEAAYTAIKMVLLQRRG